MGEARSDETKCLDAQLATMVKQQDSKVMAEIAAWAIVQCMDAIHEVIVNVARDILQGPCKKLVSTLAVELAKVCEKQPSLVDERVCSLAQQLVSHGE